MSKGSKQRPTDYAKYSENYDRIFGKKKLHITQEWLDAQLSQLEADGIEEPCVIVPSKALNKLTEIQEDLGLYEDTKPL